MFDKTFFVESNYITEYFMIGRGINVFQMPIEQSI